jgi:hypothetical protein
MVTRTNANVPREIDKLPEHDAPPVFDPPKRNTSYNERSTSDDIIVSLSNEYENRRAQQVVEWVRLQNVRRAV